MNAGDLGDRIVGWICIAAALYMILTPQDAKAIELGDPLCSSGVWVRQRYDDRDRSGSITRKIWIKRCYTQPLVVHTHLPHLPRPVATSIVRIK